MHSMGASASISMYHLVRAYHAGLQCVAMCCNVFQCVAACCSALQCVAVCCSVSQCIAVCGAARISIHRLVRAYRTRHQRVIWRKRIGPSRIHWQIFSKVSSTFVFYSELCSRLTFEKFSQICSAFL